MSLTTDLAEIDAIPVRGDFPPGLVSVVKMVKLALRASVLQFASGEPGAQPDLLEQLRKAKLLRNSDIDGVEAKSVILEKYGSRKGDFQAIENELRDKGKSVDSSVSETFRTADTTYRQVMGKVRGLSDALTNAPGPGKDQKYIAPHVADRLSAIALRTTGDVHDLVDDAKTRIQEWANGIRAATQGAKPVMANAPSTMGGRSPISMASSGPAPAAYSGSAGSPAPASAPAPTPWTSAPSTGVPAIDAAIRAAEGEFANGVRETSPNHVNRPYNIPGDLAWCASFTDWAWTQGGMDVNWTNKNLVSAVWSDARRWGWGRDGNISEARPGDMIVWGHQNHIGLVVARSGNTVTVVEGNAGNAVQRNTYSLDRGFAGVIHPPASNQVAV
ncbi:CHAP domain-containing protein [Nocardia cyriacigeorgica]|uniref:CHAP domain-containing protein n=1 Tax=Nocardia cyriacigeorgica TaxID=135487 RepID=UPI0013CF4A82|nr:CHAP domain-containing protein [Nocardia cyriacigeorgica]MBF6436471.1 CHAP domain-containing protein [Nocardia cyriacigeorgica]MBF6452040.1 CHAP domain-containing protein [Nocardia cyriacigeorgica]MBF6479488.1 CHAP domain-containing protein [Nocardia cyriacigeorgica]MBF6549209.1 CHAP domain-containing protein [Nocardia cyriacigeorgica]NEW25374.1 CHAP domain-containing protein [Nocardia cyriacigeorgica]